MERAQEHARSTGAIDSAPQKNADEGEDENVFAASGGGDGEGGDSGGGAGAGARAGPEARSGSGSMLVAEGIRSLIRATWEEVKDWCDEEAEARVRRKDAQVRRCRRDQWRFSRFPFYFYLPRLFSFLRIHMMCTAVVPRGAANLLQTV